VRRVSINIFAAVDASYYYARRGDIDTLVANGLVAAMKSWRSSPALSICVRISEDGNLIERLRRWKIPSMQASFLALSIG